MMMSLFSVFDPCVGKFQLMWLVILLLFFMVVSGVFYLDIGVSQLIVKLVDSFGKMFKDILYPHFLGLVGLGLGLFVFLFYNNFLGLFSYIFSSTSHVIMTFSLGLVMWCSCFFMGWVNVFKDSAAHLVPLGSPVILAPLLVCIEMVSHLIRPVTLSVRLAANMMAGHLIIGLLSSVSELSFMMGMVSVLLQVMMLFLELAVSLIQGFVFSVLFLLYAVEYY